MITVEKHQLSKLQENIVLSSTVYIKYNITSCFHFDTKNKTGISSVITTVLHGTGHSTGEVHHLLERKGMKRYSDSKRIDVTVIICR